MELAFLIALLAVIVWLNKDMLFGSKPAWEASDTISEDGSRKWLCSHCGKVEMTPGSTPPAPCSCRD